MATYDGFKITLVIRWGWNGRKYEYSYPTQAKLDRLVKKYGVDQVCDDVLWLRS